MNPIKKLLDFYVHLYVAEDTENDKPRVEMKRLGFLTVNLIFFMLAGLMIIYTLMKVANTFLGGGI